MHGIAIIAVFTALFSLTTTSTTIVQIPQTSTWSLLAWGFPDGGKDTTTGMKVVDLDIDTQTNQIAPFLAQGHIVMCYFSAGTLEPFRPDCQANEALWKSAVVGQMVGWDEGWLDITKLSLLQQLMLPRFIKAQQYGCQVIEPDNTDCSDNTDCWGQIAGLTQKSANSYQTTYDKWLATTAHQYGMAIALKNTLSLIDVLGPSFDCAVNEQCQQYDECDSYQDFIASGKAVFQVEYTSDPSYCTTAKQDKLMTKYCVPSSDGAGTCSQSTSWVDCFSPASQAVASPDTTLPPSDPTSSTPAWAIALIVVAALMLLALVIMIGVIYKLHM